MFKIFRGKNVKLEVLPVTIIKNGLQNKNLSLLKECFCKQRFQPKPAFGSRRKRETDYLQALHQLINIKVAYIIWEFLFFNLFMAKQIKISICGNFNLQNKDFSPGPFIQVLSNLVCQSLFPRLCVTFLALWLVGQLFCESRNC